VVRSTLMVLIVLTIATVGCGSRSPVPPTGSRNAEAPPSESAVSAFVGRWERVVTCQELVEELDKAGLGPLTASVWLGQTSKTGESSYAPGSPTPTLSHPCTGAINRQHSHFFTQGGQFGSLDWNGGQVDDGTYHIIDDHTVFIAPSGETGVTFHYAIQSGETLRLSPVLTKEMISQTLADPKNFSPAVWALSVAYPDYSWARAPCSGWC
jgi:hypothetical protein